MTSNSLAQKQWEAAAHAYERQHETNPAWRAILWPALKPVIDSLPVGEVLDVGCGPCHLASYMTARGHSVTGLDWSQAMVDIALRNAHLSRVILGNIEEVDKTTLQYGSFDVVSCINVLPDHTDYDTAIQNMARLLKPGGKCVIAQEHPVWTKRYVEDYFVETHFTSHFLGKEIPISGWHRPLQDYFSAFQDAGLILTDFCEPRPHLDLLNDTEKLKMEDANMLTSPVFMLCTFEKSM